VSLFLIPCHSQSASAAQLHRSPQKTNFIIILKNKEKKEAIESHLKIQMCWALVVHACNPSYSGGRDQEDRGLKPALANSS
jgi:hypothetical protein